MNKLTRILTMGGFGLLAALTTGAGAAHAATASGTPENKPAVSHAEWRPGVQVVGYYRSLQECELAGQFGERAGDWDDHNCSVVGLGLRRGAWALQVDSSDDWDRLGWGVPFRAVHGFPGRFRPAWFGEFRPGHFRPVIRHGGSDHGHNGHDGGHGGGHDGGHGGGHGGHGH